MNMVGHEAEGMHSIVETASPFLHQEIEAAADPVGKKYRLASVTAENDVVEPTGEMNARFSCHVDNIAGLFNLSTSKPDPSVRVGDSEGEIEEGLSKRSRVAAIALCPPLHLH